MNHIKLFESWSHGDNDYKMPYPKKIYRGYSDISKRMSKDKFGSGEGWVKFYSSDKNTANTYGYILEMIEVQLEHAFVWDANYVEYNQTSIVDILQTTYSKVLKTGEDQMIRWYGGEDYIIKKNCDGIIIKNIVDPVNGELDWTDEESENDYDGFMKALKQNASDVYILPYKNSYKSIKL